LESAVTEPYQLYRHFDANGALLYIGISWDAARGAADGGC
jgi:hypothetical protein